MGQLINEQTRGVYVIAVTPFHPPGRLTSTALIACWIFTWPRGPWADDSWHHG